MTGIRWSIPALVGLWVIASTGAWPPSAVSAGAAAQSTGARDHPWGVSRKDVDPTDLERPSAARGQRLYAAFCLVCHGPEGRGDGPAATFCIVPPADFTRAEFKVRSTPNGTLPRDADMAGVISRGAGGDGAMPAFPFLREADLRELLDQIKQFSPRWSRDPVPPAILLPARVVGDTRRGARLFTMWGCGSCHGESGRGNGHLAKSLRHSRGFPDVATDLTRPRTLKAGGDEVSLARSIVTGFNGTSMPGYSLPSGAEQGIWDLAAYLRSLQRPEPAASATSPNTAAIGGYWRTPIPRQGSGADLSAASCASCHPLQFLDWSRSRHAGAMGPGVWSQLHEQPELAPACNRCHAPLEDQAISPYLAADGVSCSACHSRGHAKFGPPPTPRTLLSIVAPYPAPHGPTGVRDFFEKAEFCAACHQFRQGEAQLVDGSFLQNTLEEWRGSRAARDGKSCQTCHMPDRRHFFRGIHDPETVRQGVKWTFDARTESRRVVARMTLTNAGSGHDFPTYVVPEVWMRIEVRDQRGVLRARSERLVARKMSFARGEWRQLSDTRLRADETATLEHAGPLPEGTSTLIGSVVVVPDAWHLESLAARLRDARSETSRRYYEAALAEANQSAYTLFRTERRLP